MVVKLQDELKQYGCDVDAQEFREILADTFARMFRGWTDERMVSDTAAARDFDNAVRRIVNCPDLPDVLINMTILNMRKNSRTKPNNLRKFKGRNNAKADRPGAG